MSNQTEITVSVHSTVDYAPIAHVTLNGHNIKSGSVFEFNGAMRSFKIVEGELWELWNKQQAFVLKDIYGNKTNARIAAYPAEKDSSGFIEFLA